MDHKIRIKVPQTVVLKDASARELQAVVESMATGLARLGKLSQEQADAVVAVLRAEAPKGEREYSLGEFIGSILDTAPQFTGGHRTQRIAHRLQEAFEHAKAGDVIEIEPAGHDLLKEYLDKPSYVQVGDKGEKRTVDGVVFTSQVWRRCCPYADAIAEPIKDEPPAEPPKTE